MFAVLVLAGVDRARRRLPARRAHRRRTRRRRWRTGATCWCRWSAGLVTFFFHPALGRAERVVNVLDAAGLALFCVTGALKALEYGLGPVPAALMGMVTGIGGGIARDVLAGRVPLVFRGELYATPALVGAVVAVRRPRGRAAHRRGGGAGRGWSASSGGCWRCGGAGTRRGPPASRQHLTRSPEHRARVALERADDPRGHPAAVEPARLRHASTTTIP